MKNIINYINESINNVDGFVVLSMTDVANLGNYSVDELSDAITDAKEQSNKYKYGTFYVVKTINNEYDWEDDSYIVFDTDALEESYAFKVIDKFGTPLAFGSEDACNDFYDGYVGTKINYNYFMLPITKYEFEYLKKNKIKYLK